MCMCGVRVEALRTRRFVTHVDLHVGQEGEIRWTGHPRGAIFLAIPARVAERVRARLLELVVGIEDVAAVVLARERDPAVVADVASVVVDVSTVIPAQRNSECASACLAWVVVQLVGFELQLRTAARARRG